MAYVIPLRVKKTDGTDRGPVALIVILTRDNLARMKEGDPFDLQTINYLPGRDQLDLVIAYEEDESKIHELGKKDDPSELLSWIERGRKHRPGDLAPPRSIRK